MAVPVVLAVLGFLTGGTVSLGAPAWLVATSQAEVVVGGVYADLPTLCLATDPWVDYLGDHYPKSESLAEIAAVADAACAADKNPNTPLGQAALVVRGVQALEKVRAKFGSAAVAKPAAASPPTIHTGR